MKGNGEIYDWTFIAIFGLDTKILNLLIPLTQKSPMLLLYRNQLIDIQCKLVGGFYMMKILYVGLKWFNSNVFKSKTTSAFDHLASLLRF